LNNAKEGKNARYRNYYRRVVVPRRLGLLPPASHQGDDHEPEAAPQMLAAGGAAATDGAQENEWEAEAGEPALGWDYIEW
jgi:hypothetical protein